MRSKVVKLAFVAVFLVASVALASAPALADGGSPFTPGDSRINPLTGDRLAVYCNATTVDVLGLDGNNNGFFLTTFSLADLTAKVAISHTSANGTVTIHRDASPVSHYGFASTVDTEPSLIIDTGTQYHINWTGGPFGANGSLPFTKSFSCTYDFVTPAPAP